MKRLPYRTWAPFWGISGVFSFAMGYSVAAGPNWIAPALIIVGPLAGIPVCLAHRLEQRWRGVEPVGGQAEEGAA